MKMLYCMLDNAVTWAQTLRFSESYPLPFFLVPLLWCSPTVVVLVLSCWHRMDCRAPREVDSEDNTCVFNSMFKEHTLERSDYSSDFRGLIRFLYAKHFMKTAAAESFCMALPLCDEAIDEDVILDHRLANGFTMLGVSFDLAKNRYLVGTSSIWQFPKRFFSG